MKFHFILIIIVFTFIIGLKAREDNTSQKIPLKYYKPSAIA